MSTSKQDIHLKLDISPCYSYLLSQHKAPLCYDCRIICPMEVMSTNVSLHIEGEHLEPYSQSIDQLVEGELVLSPPVLKIDESYLLGCDGEELMTLNCRLETDRGVLISLS